jgi:hypothetical protein
MNREIQDQQRGGESVHAVAESFHPVLATNPAPARGGSSSAGTAPSPSRRLAAGDNLRIGAVCPAAGSTGPDWLIRSGDAMCQRPSSARASPRATEATDSPSRRRTRAACLPPLAATGATERPDRGGYRMSLAPRDRHGQ